MEEFFGDGDKGPLSMEKRRSLKLPSQMRRKAVGVPRWQECRLKGRVMKRYKTGRMERSLRTPFGIRATM